MAVHSDSSQTPATSTPSRSATAPAKKPTPAAQAAPAVIVISDARTFGDAYDKNKVAADKKYKGHVVRLTATLTNVNDDNLTFGNITTKEISLTQISCRLKNEDQAEHVENDKKYTIEGKVTGQDFGVIGLDDCVVK
jgi:hypothetical protein